MEFIAIDNERLIPQQSISSVTNLDDVETYIWSTETEERRFLQIINLPLKERPPCDAGIEHDGNYRRLAISFPVSTARARSLRSAISTCNRKTLDKIYQIVCEVSVRVRQLFANNA